MTYRLLIVADGFVFTASSKGKRVPPIEDIKFSFKFKDPVFGVTEDYYLAEFIARDPEGEGDYYWIKAKRNNVASLDPTDINLAEEGGYDATSDGLIFIQPIQEGINVYPDDPDDATGRLSPVSEGDEISVEIHSLNQGAYYHLAQLQVQSAAAAGFGALFDTPASNVISNVFALDEKQRQELLETIVPAGFRGAIPTDLKDYTWRPFGYFNVALVGSRSEVLTPEVALAARADPGIGK